MGMRFPDRKQGFAIIRDDIGVDRCSRIRRITPALEVIPLARRVFRPCKRQCDRLFFRITFIVIDGNRKVTGKDISGCQTAAASILVEIHDTQRACTNAATAATAAGAFNLPMRIVNVNTRFGACYCCDLLAAIWLRIPAQESEFGISDRLVLHSRHLNNHASRNFFDHLSRLPGQIEIENNRCFAVGQHDCVVAGRGFHELIHFTVINEQGILIFREIGLDTVRLIGGHTHALQTSIQTLGGAVRSRVQCFCRGRPDKIFALIRVLRGNADLALCMR